MKNMKKIATKQCSSSDSAKKEPHAVRRQLALHLDALREDVARLTGLRRESRLQRYNSKKIPGIDFSSFLRHELVTPHDRVFQQWHPYILEFVRVLASDADADAVDTLYQRLHVGDVADQDSIDDESVEAFMALEVAIENAIAQGVKKLPVIQRAKSSARKARKKHPLSPDVKDLCAKLAKEHGKKPDIDIARDYVGNLDEKKAKSLLRQARRFPDLWKPQKR